MSYFENAKEHRIKKQLNFWVVASALLLLSNCLLSGLCWYISMNQTIEVTPFFGAQGYSKKGAIVDASYLDQMSENFILARLNVTPKNIKDNHKRVLAHVGSSAYALLSKALIAEQKSVINQDISTYFDIKEVASNPLTLSSDVKGVLRRFIGIKELASQTVHYQLHYEYYLGRIHLIGFERIKKEVNDA